MRFVFILGVLLATFAHGASDLEPAIALYREKKFPEARLAFEKILASEPTNAVACHFLGLTLLRRGDDQALDEAVPWLEKAATLAPTNAEYLADFGGASMQLASKRTSLSAATKGRDAMEQSLKLQPNNIEARIGLWQFYERAPWPLGSSKKAAAQIEEIRKLDPTRATVLTVVQKTTAKEFPAAFKICDEVLARQPDNFTALYYYGRTAATSGQNLQRGLASLQRCLSLPEQGPSSPAPSDIWNRIGNVQEKLARPNDARTAYETALKLNPGNRAAQDALAKLKSR